MNATTSPLPASLLRAESDDHSLDARILRTEQRLIAREENLRRGVSTLAVGLPLAEQLLGQRPAAPLVTALPLPLSHLSGTWYELARMPGHGAQPAAPTVVQHRLRGDGGFDVLERAPGPEPGSGGARLRISRWPEALRWLPLAWREEWVLHLDPDATELLLGSPERDVLRLQGLLEIARDQGYAVERLQFTDAS